MQIRKLVKSGYASLVVAVPKDWIDKHKLKPGDLLYIDEEGDKLSLSTEKKEKHEEVKSITINVDSKNVRLALYEITAAYLNNYHQITIKSKDLLKVSNTIKNYIKQLVALELVEDSSDKIVATSFLNIADSNPTVVIRRMDNIVRSMITDTKEVFNKPELAQVIFDRDKEVNRLNILMYKLLKYAHSNREIIKTWGMEEIAILRYWDINISLEKIGDRIKNIARLATQLDKQRRKKFLSLFDRIEKTYKANLKSFYSHSFRDASETSIGRQDILADIQKDFVNNKCVICSKLAINFFIMVANINNISRAVRYLD